jgi:hypothetical protein
LKNGGQEEGKGREEMIRSISEQVFWGKYFKELRWVGCSGDGEEVWGRTLGIRSPYCNFGAVLVWSWKRIQGEWLIGPRDTLGWRGVTWRYRRSSCWQVGYQDWIQLGEVRYSTEIRDL